MSIVHTVAGDHPRQVSWHAEGWREQPRGVAERLGARSRRFGAGRIKAVRGSPPRAAGRGTAGRSGRQPSLHPDEHRAVG